MNTLSRRGLTSSLPWVLGLSEGLSRLPSASAAETADATKQVSSEVEWHIQEDQIKPLLKSAQVKRVTPDQTRNPLLIGVAIYVGISLLPELAQSILDVYYRYKSGGVIIDVRNTPIVIQTSKSVAPGYALIISAEGARTVQLGGAQKADASVLSSLLTAAVKK
jgi:hypothetical protein